MSLPVRVANALTKTKERGPWRVTKRGLIRNSRNECPLAAECNRRGLRSAGQSGGTFRNKFIYDAGHSLGLHVHDAYRIVVQAADNPRHFARASLLQLLDIADQKEQR